MTPDRIGIPLVCTYAAQRLGVYEFLTVHDDTPPTHVALSLDPQKRAEYRDAVVEAVTEAWASSSFYLYPEEAVEAAFTLLLGSGGES